jgi:hypothetical protein
MLPVQVETPDGANAGAEADSPRGMTDRKARARARTTGKATAKTGATAGPSTAFGAKNAPNSAQDDSMFEFVQEDGAQRLSVFVKVGVCVMEKSGKRSCVFPAFPTTAAGLATMNRISRIGERLEVALVDVCFGAAVRISLNR